MSLKYEPNIQAISEDPNKVRVIRCPDFKAQRSFLFVKMDNCVHASKCRNVNNSNWCDGKEYQCSICNTVFQLFWEAAECYIKCKEELERESKKVIEKVKKVNNIVNIVA